MCHVTLVLPCGFLGVSLQLRDLNALASLLRHCPLASFISSLWFESITVLLSDNIANLWVTFPWNSKSWIRLVRTIATYFGIEARMFIYFYYDTKQRSNLHVLMLIYIVEVSILFALPPLQDFTHQISALVPVACTSAMSTLTPRLVRLCTNDPHDWTRIRPADQMLTGYWNLTPVSLLFDITVNLPVIYPLTGCPDFVGFVH